VTSDAFAEKTRSHEILGPAFKSYVARAAHDEKTNPDMIEAARIVAVETGAFWTIR